jgi:hypothetical protein
MSGLSPAAFVPVTLGGHLLVQSRFHVTCQQCEHERTLDLISLKRRLGTRTLMIDVLDRLVCEECRGREYSVSANEVAPKTYSIAEDRDRRGGYWWLD